MESRNSQTGEFLPLCRKCGQPVPIGNDVKTLFLFLGKTVPSCHYMPVTEGPVLCVGAREYDYDIPTDRLSRLRSKMSAAGSG